MWRALVFIGLLCVAAFGAVWLADRPGTVLVTFGGYELQTSVAVAAIALVAVALALALLWAAIYEPAAPARRLTFASRARRRARRLPGRVPRDGGGGGRRSYRRAALCGRSRELLGREALTLLLKRSRAGLRQPRGAEAAFTK